MANDVESQDSAATAGTPRAAVDPLKQSLMKKSTHLLYLNALNWFSTWLRFWTRPWPVDGDDLDHRVCEFGECAWEDGESRAVVALLASVIRYFKESLVGSLFAARRLISAWDKAKIVFHSFPFTPLISEALAGRALCNGWLLDAVTMVLGTAGMLRVLELLSPTAAQVSGSLSYEAVVITLSDTETCHRKQTMQHASLREPVAAASLLISNLTCWQETKSSEGLLRKSFEINSDCLLQISNSVIY